ncbi:MAG: phosphoglycolate phosphatase [Granulosicoccus sp.]
MTQTLITIDLDGTLVDSVGDLHASVNDMQAQLGGAPRSVEQVRTWVGNGIDKLVHRAITDSMDEEVSRTEFPEALWRFRQSYQRNNGTRSTVYPGVVKTLEHLRSNGYRLICVTNKAAQFTLPLLKNLNIEHLFELTVSGDDLAEKKPHPAQLLHAATTFSIKPENCAHVGDSVSDIKAARAAGFNCICVSYGYNHGQSVWDLTGDLKPDLVVDQFDELIAHWAESVLPDSTAHNSGQNQTT